MNVLTNSQICELFARYLHHVPSLGMGDSTGMQHANMLCGDIESHLVGG